jgi:hypothetical protein
MNEYWDAGETFPSAGMMMREGGNRMMPRLHFCATLQLPDHILQLTLFEPTPVCAWAGPWIQKVTYQYFNLLAVIVLTLILSIQKEKLLVLLV